MGTLLELRELLRTEATLDPCGAFARLGLSARAGPPLALSCSVLLCALSSFTLALSTLRFSLQPKPLRVLVLLLCVLGSLRSLGVSLLVVRVVRRPRSSAA